MATKKEKLRHALDVIDRFLVDDENQCDGTSEALWDVLTALRGPDEGDVDEKNKTTTFIRSAAFTRLARQDGGNVPASFYLNGMRIQLGGSRGHFRGHIVRAAHALGLTCENT